MTPLQLQENIPLGNGEEAQGLACENDVVRISEEGQDYLRGEGNEGKVGVCGRGGVAHREFENCPADLCPAVHYLRFVLLPCSVDGDIAVAPHAHPVAVRILKQDSVNAV